MLKTLCEKVSSLVGKKNQEIQKTPTIISVDEHKIDNRFVSWQAKIVCENLQRKGFKAYIVGGAVRDLLLGVKPKDFDVATNATPEEVKRCQRRALIIGRRFRLVHVVFGREVIECSTFRALDAMGVRKDASGRVISDNVFGTMWEDAARRDFTVNALYYDLVTGEVFDYHEGYKDIKRQCLRMIGDPVERYREDPVRMMRAIRIASKLDFKIEKATQKAIAKMAGLLANVPDARLFDEMMKLFTSGAALKALLAMKESNLHRSLLPMLDVIFSEAEGEKFLLLALKRTDERIAIGKKISPAFMFATLLWPQVKKRWDVYQKDGKMASGAALFEAAEEVVAKQAAMLAIQNRFVVDMKTIWMMQLRFEKRTGKTPYALITHPKYRAGYDFMLLRSQLGHVDPALVAWWENFVASDDVVRASMIQEAEDAARQTAAAARRGNEKKKKEEKKSTTKKTSAKKSAKKPAAENKSTAVKTVAKTRARRAKLKVVETIDA